MSYAIIRNEKYTKDEMIQLAPHNERFKKKYSNKNIDLSKTSQNYHLKLPKENTYLKEYNRLIKENNLAPHQFHANDKILMASVGASMNINAVIYQFDK